MLPPAGGVETELALTFSLQVKISSKHTFLNRSIIKTMALFQNCLVVHCLHGQLPYLTKNVISDWFGTFCIILCNPLWECFHRRGYMICGLGIWPKGRYRRNNLCFKCSLHRPLTVLKTEPILFSRHHHHINVHWIILEFYYGNWVWFSSFCPVCACFYVSSTLIFWSVREISCKSCFRGGRGTKTEQFWVTRRWLLVL